MFIGNYFNTILEDQVGTLKRNRRTIRHKQELYNDPGARDGGITCLYLICLFSDFCIFLTRALSIRFVIQPQKYYKRATGGTGVARRAHTD